MKKVLVFCAGGQTLQESLQIEESIEQYRQGNDVTFLSCDEIVGGCNDNQHFNKKYCKECKLFQKINRYNYLPKGIKQLKTKDVVTNEMLEEAEKKFPYVDIESLRQIKYHGVDIGLGTVSSYVSYTRDLNPIIDARLRLYFDKILRSQVILTLIIEYLHKTNHYDLFIFHNGRFAIYKPMLNIAQRESIDFICTESYLDAKGNISKNYFYNDIPHNLKPFQEKIMAAWKDAKDNGIDRISIGKSFFERKINAQGTGDKIYTTGQDETIFVEDWDESKENIVIFNSSEDEFYAVSGDFAKGKVFSSQIEGIKTILEHYKSDRGKHFYLRVHPNLIPVKYSYHTDLYKLDYPNLTVIPADSPISSYTLLYRADKVITFGSTMGIEAVYAHKPSICIGPSLYEMLNVAYHPKSTAEVWKYIDCKDLKDKYDENVLMYGYFFMGVYNSILKDPLKYIDARQQSYKIGGKQRLFRAYEKIGGSHLLYLGVRFILNYFLNRNPKQ